MKTKIPSSPRLPALSLSNGLLASLLLTVAVGVSGCSSFPDKLAKYDALGIEYAEITGKWTHTVYQRTEDNGEIRSELTHNNPWVPKVHIIRRRPAAQD